MPPAQAVRDAIHLMGDAQAMLDGAGADIAAAQLDMALHRAEDFLREFERDQALPK